MLNQHVTTTQSVAIRAGTAHFTNFCETDPQVVRILSQATDPSEVAHHLLRAGAAALGVSADTISADLIDEKFESLVKSMGNTLESSVREIVVSLNGFIETDTGALPTLFDSHREDLSKLLTDTFDPESTKSVIAVMNGLLEQAREEQVTAISEFVNDKKDGPLAKVSESLTNEVRRAASDLSGDITFIAEKLAAKEAVKEVISKSPTKGRLFEDHVFETVTNLVAPFGDLTEGTGSTYGVKGTKKGDVVVTVAPGPNSCADARFVIEAKTQQNLSARKIFEELDEAQENREAKAAIMVFDTLEAAPTDTQFYFHDNKAIAVYDGEDDSALRLALMWASWVTRRESVRKNLKEINAEGIETLIGTAHAQLNRFSTVRSHHTASKNAIDKASVVVSEIKNDLSTVLEELSSELQMPTH